MDMQFHEAANIFPLLEGDELDQLAESIRDKGLQVDIEIFEGKIIDGRNRYRACLMAGVEPEYVETELTGSPTDYVMALNLHRRHLNESQRAMVAAKAKERYTAEAKERQKQSKGRGKKGVANLPPQKTGKARDKAGEAVGVSGKSVDHATKVVATGAPEVVAAVESGELPVSKAAKLATLPAEEQAAAIEGGKSAINAAVARATPKAPPKPFDEVEAGDRLRDWLRAELEKWPKEHQPSAAHQILQIVHTEFQL
jgi:hypothetical protein